MRERNRGRERGRGKQRVLSRPSLVACCIIQICPEKNTRLNFKGMKKSTNEHTVPLPPSPSRSLASLLAFLKSLRFPRGSARAGFTYVLYLANLHRAHPRRMIVRHSFYARSRSVILAGNAIVLLARSRFLRLRSQFFADLAIYAQVEGLACVSCIFGLSRRLACETAIKSNIRAVQFVSRYVDSTFRDLHRWALLQPFSIEKFDAQ